MRGQFAGGRANRHWAGTALVILGLLPLAAAAAADSVHVIANADTSAAKLSRTTLRAIYSMRVRQMADGTPLTVFVLSDRDERHRAFCKDVLQVYPYVLRDNWDRLVFTGTGQTPVEVASQEELIRRVAQTRGGIGYVVKEGSLAHEHVKMVDIYESP